MSSELLIRGALRLFAIFRPRLVENVFKEPRNQARFAGMLITVSSDDRIRREGRYGGYRNAGDGTFPTFKRGSRRYSSTG